jgi:hypothetical protein
MASHPEHVGKPDDWVCPDCGTPKRMFEMVEIGYARGGPDLARVA